MTWDICLTEDDVPRVHWWATKLSSESKVWQTSISADDLQHRPSFENHELTYVCLNLPQLKRTTDLPIIDSGAHITISYGYDFHEDWALFWRWRHSVATLLAQRTVSAICVPNGRLSRFDVLEISELGQLLVMLREVATNLGIVEPVPYPEEPFHISWRLA